MIITVDTRAKKLYARGSKTKISIPENHMSWLLEVEQSLKDSVVNTEAVIEAIRVEKSCIVFCSVSGEEYYLDGQGHTLHRSVYKDEFKFDLADYQLKSMSGGVVSPRILMSRVPSQMRMATDTEPSWLLNFYLLWKRLTYKGGTQKVKLFYMFEDAKYHKDILTVAEKLFKTGVSLGNTDSMIDICKRAVNQSQKEKNEDGTSKDVSHIAPADLFGVPNYVYKDISTSPELMKSLSGSYSALQNLHEFTKWDLVWNQAKSLGVLSEFFDRLIVNRSDALHRMIGLICDRYYDSTRLLQYLFHDLPEKQGLTDPAEGANLLDDYASMTIAVYDEIDDKYPDYLKTMHDVVLAKFNKLQIDLQNKECMKAYKNHDRYGTEPWVYSDGTNFGPQDRYSYFMTIPDSADDIVKEGKVMHHCVASYVNLLAQNPEKRAIVFLRTRDNTYSSWSSRGVSPTCTIEIYDGRIAQARGPRNVDPTAQEFEFIQKWCLVTNIGMVDNWQKTYKRITGKDFIDPLERKEVKENE